MYTMGHCFARCLVKSQIHMFDRFLPAFIFLIQSCCDLQRFMNTVGANLSGRCFFCYSGKDKTKSANAWDHMIMTIQTNLN